MSEDLYGNDHFIGIADCDGDSVLMKQVEVTVPKATKIDKRFELLVLVGHEDYAPAIALTMQQAVELAKELLATAGVKLEMGCWVEGEPPLYHAVPATHKRFTSDAVDICERIEKCAQLSSEINRAYCEAIGDPPPPSWEDAPEWQRDSARNGVKATLDGSVRSPQESHESWLAHDDVQLRLTPAQANKLGLELLKLAGTTTSPLVDCATMADEIAQAKTLAKALPDETLCSAVARAVSQRQQQANASAPDGFGEAK